MEYKINIESLQWFQTSQMLEERINHLFKTSPNYKPA